MRSDPRDDRSGLGGTDLEGSDLDGSDLDSPEGPDRIEDIADMSEIEELDDIEELDGEDALDGDEDALDIDALEGDDDDIDATGDDDEALDAVLDVATVAPDAGPAKVTAPADGAAEPETDDDELLADEVEASLDVILAERLRGEDSEADEQLEDDEDDAPNQLATVIPVRQPDEFLCQSCFLLKPPGQLADRDHQLCRDCA